MGSKRNGFMLFLWIVVVFTFVSALAEGVDYFYDDTGRLVRLSSGNEGLVYRYDNVGNLQSISKGAINAGQPVLQNIQPDVLFIGSATAVSVLGKNLFTTKTVTSNSQFLNIKILEISETEVKALMKVSPDAVPGTAIITVTTIYGSANISVNLTLSKLTFNPGQLSIAPGGIGIITAAVYPSLGRNVTIAIRNNNPSIVSAPQSVTIPSSGSADFTVSALKEGVATVDSGDPGTIIMVNAFTLPPGETITQNARPVSVYVETSATGSNTTPSLPISVYLETPATAINTTPSLPVSVYVETPATVSNTTPTMPVSVYVEAPAGNSTVVSLPVSTKTGLP